MNIALFLALASALLGEPSVTSPDVYYSVARTANGLEVVVEAEGFSGLADPPTLALGVSAVRKRVLAGTDARKVTTTGATARWSFDLAAGDLVDGPGDWKLLRMGMAVTWPGGFGGQPRLMQRFLHTGSRAAHAGLSENPEDWQAIDLEALARAAADREREIAFTLKQPLDGKATVVIDDASGARVRNLVSGRDMEAGEQRLVWDGLDDSGKVVEPGEFRWRAISHPGLKPVHAMDFCAAPGSNHGTLHAAATGGDRLYFASPVAEGGYELIELSAEGEFRRGFNPPHGHGLGTVAIAVGDGFLYAAHDGLAWGDHVDRSAPDWTEERTLSVVRIDLAEGTVSEFSGGVRHAVVRRYGAGPGSASKLPKDEMTLAGLAIVGGHLYLADNHAGEALVIDPASGALEKTFPLADPVALSARDGVLFAIAAGSLVAFDPTTGESRVLAEIRGEPAGLFAAPEGQFYVSDRSEQNVQVLDVEGKLLKTVGSPGGLAPGAYDPMKFQNPSGIVALDGNLWVTEKDRRQPKRLSAFSLATGEPVREYGPTAYGAPGAGFDPEDGSRWIGQGALWELDFASGTARPDSVLGGEDGRRHSFWRQDGRTFVLTSGKASWVQELRDDGTLRPLACVSSAHQFAFAHDWRPPDAFIEAFQRDYPEVDYPSWKTGGIQADQPAPGPGMLWVDRDGDGAMDASEIEFATGASDMAGSGWSHDFYGLTVRVPGVIAGEKVLIALVPDGWWPGGAPRYPALADAVQAAVKIELPGSSEVESLVDRFGNTVLNSDPEMRCFSPDGRLFWKYPNRWSNVHGSHDAPLPRTGELQGALFFSGQPLDAGADVFVINGNHGRAFVMTSDGLYLDEMFTDVRLMTNPQAGGVGILGGECFGGTFGRAEDSGHYYFQGGGISYRIYQVQGLDKTVRGEGTLSVSADQVSAAARTLARGKTSGDAPRTATIAAGEIEEVAAWDRGGKFSVTVGAATGPDVLRLRYAVSDESPWVNHGKDWQALFKTGDGIDFQLEPTLEQTLRDQGRAPGDLRLFVAPMGAETVAVLYRHRVPGAPENAAVIFQSPWRSEKVDLVRRLENIEARVVRGDGGYRIDLTVPLAELGLDPATELRLRGDFGVIYGDAAGTTNVFRNYWSNRATGLINDVPGEIMLSPSRWGDITFAPAP